MSKNQQPRIFQATKKLNPVFRLQLRFRYQAGTKLSFNLQSQIIQEHNSVRLALSGVPLLAGVSKLAIESGSSTRGLHFFEKS